MFNNDVFWLVVGFSGQIMFSLRFIVQWLSSERVGKSVVPTHFWYFSLAGGALLLIYAIHRLDAVFVLGQASGLLIYLRNLHLISRERRTVDATGGDQLL